MESHTETYTSNIYQKYLSARVPAGWRRSPVQAERKWQQPADLGAGKRSYSGGHRVAVLHPKSLIVVAYGKGSLWTLASGTGCEQPQGSLRGGLPCKKTVRKTEIKLTEQKLLRCF